MKTSTSSQLEQTNTEPETTRSILIWDLPLRVFHWLMVICFTGAYLTSEGERWRAVHVTLGYTLGGLIVFRLIWGFFGTKYARFSDFVRGPSAVINYLRSLIHGRPKRFLGHNPAGAFAIITLLTLGALVVGTGWYALQESSPDIWEYLHEGMANLMLAVVMVHIAAVIVSSRIHRENLLASMFHGKKEGDPERGISRIWGSVGILLLLGVAAFWWLRWRLAGLS